MVAVRKDPRRRAMAGAARTNKKKTMKTNKQINNKTSVPTQENQSNVKGLRSRSEQVGNVQNEQKAEQPVAKPQPTWSGVFFNGPEPEQDREGEEIPKILGVTPYCYHV